MRYFNLHSNCIPVLGAKNSIICDLFRERYLRVPKSLALAFIQDKSIPVNDISTLGPDMINLLNLLEQEDWGHFTHIPHQFLPLELNYEFNGKISNCIIDINDTPDYEFKKLATQLDELFCHAVQIRFFKVTEIDYVKELLNYFKDTSIQYLEILLQYDNSNYNEQNLKLLLGEQIRLKNIYIFSAPKNEIVTFTSKTSGHKWRVIYSTNPFTSEKECGKITKERFAINLHNFTEAKNFNSCLNCKISIDKDGYLKNCPSFENNFGNIKTDSLSGVLERKEYTRYFSVRKDDIDICKDCEFRYICTDCRVYVQDSSAVHKKPSKCSYDPYTGVWA